MSFKLYHRTLSAVVPAFIANILMVPGAVCADQLSSPVIITSTNNVIRNQANTQRLLLSGGHTDDALNGAFIYIYGNGYPDNAGKLHIGTVAASPFHVWTNNQVRMTVDDAGRVGIGTQTPASRLSILGGSGQGFAVFNSAATTAGSQIGMIGFASTPGFNEGLRAGLKAHVSEYVANGNVGMHLDFYTAMPNAGDGAHRMRITSDGSVGIGTLTPMATLDVNGNARFSAGIEINGGIFAAGKIYHSLSDGLSIGAKTGSNYNFTLANSTGSAYLLRNPSGTNTMEFPNAVSMGSTLGVSGLITATDGIEINGGIFAAGKIYHSLSDGLSIGAKTGSSYNFTLANNTGSAYLLRNPTGTNTLEFPNAVAMGSTLGVAEEGTFGNLKVGIMQAVPGGYVGFKGLENLSTTDFALSQLSNGRTTLNAPAGQTVAISVDGSVKMTVEEDKVIVSPGVGFEVAGTFTAHTVKATGWEIAEAPDYVFEKGYKLASLEKIESFVKENKHLPEVPSAKRMKEDGLDLVKMNFILLKKVEELTLHAIRQEKEMKRQAEEIHRLKRFNH